MEKRFIEVTSAYHSSKGEKLTLSVDGIGGMFIEDGDTRLLHSTHGNGSYKISETPDQIKKLIKESKPI